jgi:hypothetical protein
MIADAVPSGLRGIDVDLALGPGPHRLHRAVGGGVVAHEHVEIAFAAAQAFQALDGVGLVVAVDEDDERADGGLSSQKKVAL